MDSASTQSQLDWRHLPRLLRRYKGVTATVFVLGMVVSVIYTSQLPVQYRSISSALIENAAKGPFEQAGLAQDFSRAHKILAESRPVMLRTQELAGPGEGSASAFEARAESQLIYFMVTDSTPPRAARVANAWAMAFIEEMTRRAKAPNLLQKDFLERSLPDLRREWIAKQEALNGFQRESNFDLGSFEKHPVRKRFDALSDQIGRLNMDLGLLQAEKALIESLEPSSTQLLLLRRAKSEPALHPFLRDIEQHRFQVRQARQSYREGSLEIKVAEENLASAYADLGEVRELLLQAVDLEIESVEGERASMQILFDQAETEYNKLLEKAARIRVLGSEVVMAEKLYSELATKQGEANVRSQYDYVFARLWEQALENPVPFKPNWRFNMLVGCLLSLFLAIGAVYGLDRLDDTIRGAKDLERKLGVSVLGSIPAYTNLEGETAGYLLAQRHPISAVTDSLRGIHIGLEVSRRSKQTEGGLVITVTSPTPSDGKTFIASNLGILFGSLGRRVLVVDADLRKCSLSKVFQYANRPGFREALESGIWNAGLVCHENLPGYSLLPAGKALEGKADSLDPDKIKLLIGKIRSEFDVIVFDTAPVLAIPDACVLCQGSDVTVMVARSRRARLAHIQRAAEILYSANAKDLAFVVNAIDVDDAATDAYGYGYGYSYGGYGYGKGRGYGYGYGYGYGAAEQEAAKRMGGKVVQGPRRPDDQEVDEGVR